MSTHLLKPLLLGASLFLIAISVHAGGPATVPGKDELVLDTIQMRALLLLQTNLEQLKDPYQHGEFAKTYASGAQHYCDHCPEPRHVDIATYLSFFPRGLTFTSEVDKAGIVWKMVEIGQYEVVVPFRKRLPKLTPDGLDPGRTFWVDLVARMFFDYNTGSFKITDVRFDRAPAAEVLILEASPLFGLGSLKFDDTQGSVPTTKSFAATLGVMYYFNPFGGTNRKNIWLKAGLRAGQRRVKLTGDGLVFTRRDLALVTTGASPAFPMHENIDVTKTVNGIEETVTSTVVEIPLGVSKRWNITREMDFSMELEVGYGFEASRKVSGGYTVDQVGTDHRIFVGGDQTGVVMLQGGGNNAPRVYDTDPAAVVSVEEGRINFYRGEQGSLAGLDSKGKGYLTFGLNPSIFLRKGGSDHLRWNIGLRLAMQQVNVGEGDVDAAYFIRGEDSSRAALSSLSTSKYQTYIGFFVGMNLL